MTDTVDLIAAPGTRYDIGKGHPVSALIHTWRRRVWGTVEAELLRISSCDARLRTQQPVAAKEIVGLQLRAKNLNRMISVSSEACWIVPARGNRWWVGCAFDPPIPAETLAHLAAIGILERRHQTRERITLAATARWELSGEASTVQVVDYSREGLCLKSAEKGRPGERLLLQLQTGDGQDTLVWAKAQWQVETDDGFVVGCRLLNAEDHKVISAAKELEDLAGPKWPLVRRWLARAPVRSSEPN